MGVAAWGVFSHGVFVSTLPGIGVRLGRCLPGKPRGIDAFGVRWDGLPGCRGEAISGLAWMRERRGVPSWGAGWGTVRRKP